MRQTSRRSTIPTSETRAQNYKKQRQRGLDVGSEERKLKQVLQTFHQMTSSANIPKQVSVCAGAREEELTLCRRQMAPL